MLKNLVSLRGAVYNFGRCYATSAAPKDNRLFAAACVERFPVVSCEMNEMEKKYADFITKLNDEKSYLSSHELRHNKDIELKKKQTGKDEADVVIETALDFEEKCEAEFKKFNFGQREPAEKDKNNFKTLKRLLNRKLILLVKDPETKEWQFPTDQWTQGESLRKTAERSLNAFEDVNFKFIGNAPVGFLKNKQKTYFFKAQYPSNEDINSKIVEHVWVTKDELKNYIKCDVYLATIEKFILDF